MIVVMQPGAAVADISRVIRQIEDLGLQALPSHGSRCTVIGILGARGESELEPVVGLPGVEQVAPISKAFKLVNREFRAEPTVVDIDGVRVGGEEFVVIAGPCSVESPEQLGETAAWVQRCGGRLLRGGAFKPRTSPYSFQGLGEEGLRILRDAKQSTGLPVVTEVTAPDLVPLVGRYADVLQVGTRNMQNYALLDAVGNARKPVLLKRGMMSTIEEMLLAAEYILSRGNGQVMLCERGIRTFERATRNTLDLSAVPVIKQASHLPVIIDPSHATGRKDCIPAMARAAAAAGADGIMVEVHPRPEEALSDGAQSLTFPEFAELMDGLRPIAEAMGRPMAAELKI